MILPSAHIDLCWLAGMTTEEALANLKEVYKDYSASTLVKHQHVLDIYTYHYRGYGIMQKVNWEKLVK